MPFDYNDRLVIRDRKQMEDLFKYRLDQFDANRTKKIIITNRTPTIILLLGKFDKTKSTLNLDLYDATHVTTLPDHDINLVLRYDNLGIIELLTKINLQDE